MRLSLISICAAVVLLVLTPALATLLETDAVIIDAIPSLITEADDGKWLKAWKEWRELVEVQFALQISYSEMVASHERMKDRLSGSVRASCSGHMRNFERAEWLLSFAVSIRDMSSRGRRQREARALIAWLCQCADADSTYLTEMHMGASMLGREEIADWIDDWWEWHDSWREAVSKAIEAEDPGRAFVLPGTKKDDAGERVSTEASPGAVSGWVR